MRITCHPHKNYFISSHFFGKKEAENLALRDQELCVAAHLFAQSRIWLEKIWPPKVTNFIFKICQYIIN